MIDHNSRSLIEQALSSLADSEDAQLQSLMKSIHIIDDALQYTNPIWIPETDDEWWWTLHRLRTLQHIDRLHTTKTLCNGSFNPEIYSHIRDADISNAAEDFSRNGNLRALNALLTAHPYSLLPSILNTLSYSPETLPPQDLVSILHTIAMYSSQPPCRRSADWAESESMCMALRRRGEHHLLLCTERLAGLNLGWSPVETRAMYMWIRQRAFTVDGVTGQLGQALSLVEQCCTALPSSSSQQQGNQQQQQQPSEGDRTKNDGIADEQYILNDILQMGRQLTLVYGMLFNKDIHASSSLLWDKRYSLQQFAGMNDVERLHALLQCIDMDALEREIESTIVPFLQCYRTTERSHDIRAALSTWTGNDTLHAADVLIRYLEQESITRLPWVARFIELESKKCIALGTPDNVARAACAAVYGTPSTDSWDLQNDLIHAAADAFIRTSPTYSTVSPRRAAVRTMNGPGLMHNIALVKGHVTAAHLLTTHGLPTAARAVRDASHGDALDMVKRLLGRLSRMNPSESTWVDVWDDLEIIQDQGLNVLPLHELRAQYCRVLLTSGHTRLARRHLDLLQDDENKKEELVLSCARQVIYGETTFDAKAMKVAKDVLSLLPNSDAAREEESFIHAASKLTALSIDMPPLQLKQSKDTAAILEQAIRAAPRKVLKDVDGLVELSNTLQTGRSKSQVMSLIARIAMEREEHALAEEIALKLAQGQSPDGWQIALHIAMENCCSKEHIRRSLLAYALRYVSGQEIQSPLLCWQASDAGSSAMPECWNIPESSQESMVNVTAEHSQTPNTYAAYAEQVLNTFSNQNSSSSSSSSSSSGGGTTMSAGHDDSSLMYYDSMALMTGCLISLGPEYQQQWGAFVLSTMQKSAVDIDALKRVHVVSITAAAFTILATLFWVDDSKQEQAIATNEPTTATATNDDDNDKNDDNNSTAETYKQQLALLSSPPKNLLSQALHKSNDLSVIYKDILSPHQVQEITDLRALLLQLSHSMVSAADAHRVAEMLPGQHNKEEQLFEADASTQRQIILQLAVAAGGGGSGPAAKNDIYAKMYIGDGEDEDDMEYYEDAQYQSHTQPTLDQVLTLATRYNVLEVDVKLSYAIALMQGTFTEESGDRLDAVWPSLLKHRPKETLDAFLTQVYPSISDRNLSHMSLLFKLCSECCSSLSTQDSVHDSEREYRGTENRKALTVLADALMKLSLAVVDLDEQQSGIHQGLDSTVLLQPFMHTVAGVLGISIHTQKIVEQSHDDSIKIALQLIEWCTLDNARVISKFINLISDQYTVLLSVLVDRTDEFSLGKYPVTGNAAYIAAACCELSALTITEDASTQHLHRLTQCFAAMADGEADVAMVCSYACIEGSEYPLHVDNKPLPPSITNDRAIWLTEEQRRAILHSVFDGNPSFLNLKKKETPVHPAVDVVHRVYIELCRIDVIYALSCAALELYQDQIDATQQATVSIVTSMLASSHHHLVVSERSGTVEHGMLVDHVVHLYDGGCSIYPDINMVVESIRGIMHGTTAKMNMDTMADAHTATTTTNDDSSDDIEAWCFEMLLEAAEAAVRESLSALTSDAGTTEVINKKGRKERDLSVGDAIQNLFGMLRSLDCTGNGVTEKKEKLHAVRLHVWRILQEYASHHQAVDDTAKAEGHLQVLEMLGSLGRSKWIGFSLESEQHDGESHVVHAAFTQGPLFLHSKVAATLSAIWPGALHAANVTAEDFSNASNAVHALLRVIETAQTAEHVQGVVTVLIDILHNAYSEDNNNNDDDDDDAVQQEETANSAHTIKVHYLHRCWSACIMVLLRLGEVHHALSALDAATQGLSPGIAVALTHQETVAIVDACDAAGGALCAGAAAFLVGSYDDILANAWLRLIELPAVNEDVQGLPGSMALGIVLMSIHADMSKDSLSQQRGELDDNNAQNASERELSSSSCYSLPHLLKQNPALVKQLCLAFLNTELPALVYPCIAISNGSQSNAPSVSMSVRSSLALMATAQLVASDCLEAAAWVALEHAGIHPLLRVLDSGMAALKGLLGAGSKIAESAKSTGTAMEIEEKGMVQAVVVYHRMRTVVQWCGHDAVHSLNVLLQRTLRG